MDITIKVTGLDRITAALEKIAAALPAPAAPQQIQQPAAPTPAPQPEQLAPAAPQQPIQQPQQAMYVAPMQTQPAPVTCAAPQQPIYTPPIQQNYIPTAAPQQPQYAPPAAPAVPVTPQSYTMEQLAVAATQLMDAGRIAELQQLLAAFGVQALTVLPKEQYGNFATQLRAMGAKI